MTMLQPGQMLGPYQIISQIGKGGMATVYKAYHAAMDRYVALKVVAAQFTDDPNFMQRFRQEVRLIARLEHPNILPVHDFGEANGVPYMVMRFIDSGTLQERLASGLLSLAEVDQIFSQLANALEYAHENGVIHRDIKPSNAMLDKRGIVFLTDFGVARMLEGSSKLTATGAITGTPAYMSPEQAQGLNVDQRSDIYSLGVLLFEMLAGRVPFEAETPMAVLFKQIQEPPPPLSSVRPDLHYSLEAVLLRALAKDPEDRYPSMQAFLSGWKSAYSEASTSAGVLHAPVMVPEFIPSKQTGMPMVAAIQPGSGSAPAAQPAKRNFKMAALILLVVLICLVAGAALAIFGMRAYRSRQTTSARVPAAARTQPAPAQTAPAELPVAPAGAAASWSGANTVYAIAFNGDSVLAAGEGGITIWNRKDGSSKQISTAGGLPGGVVLSILVDNDGSIWAGTDNGLAHLNASPKTVYSAADGLDSEYVIALARSGGRLFAGTQYSSKQGGGLLEFNGSAWQPVAGFPSSDKPAAGLVSSNVRQVVVDARSNVWVATEQGIARQDDKNQWTVFSSANGLQDENIYTIYADRNNDIFAGAANGVVEKFNPDKGAFESYANLSDRGLSDIYGILQDKNGNLWFSGGVVARFDPSTRTWTNFGPADGSFPASSARALAMDDRGDLYFGTYEQGLVHFSDAKFDTRMVPNRPRFGEYDRIIAAPDGKLIFVQVYASGADEFDPAANSWSAVPSEQNVPGAFDAHGQMWSGGSDGLWIFGAGKTTHLSTDQGLPSNQVNAIAFGADGTAFIATEAGIAVFDGLTVTDVYSAAKNGLASDEVSTLFMATDGSLWAGTSGGFSRRQPDGKWQNFTAQGLFGGFADSFPAFAQDHAGNIWVATSNDGVYRFSNGAWKRLRSTDPGVGLPSDEIISITVAPGGTLWFGSNGQGAVRFDGKTWKAYGLGDGLIDVHINDIYAGPDGSLWFTTGGGISHLSP